MTAGETRSLSAADRERFSRFGSGGSAEDPIEALATVEERGLEVAVTHDSLEPGCRCERALEPERPQCVAHEQRGTDDVRELDARRIEVEEDVVRALRPGSSYGASSSQRCGPRGTV